LYGLLHGSGLELEKNKGKASLSSNITKFFRASMPVHRASRFKASLKILFSCYFEVSNNRYTEQQQYLKNAKQNYGYFNT
jgi:hypothetical protein